MVYIALKEDANDLYITGYTGNYSISVDTEPSDNGMETPDVNHSASPGGWNDNDGENVHSHFEDQASTPFEPEVSDSPDHLIRKVG